MAVLIVTYPATPGAKFDRDYYVRVHLPLAEQHLSPSGLTSTKALFPLAPDAPWLCLGILTFSDAAALGAALSLPAAADVMADIANFTDVEPTATAMA